MLAMGNEGVTLSFQFVVKVLQRRQGQARARDLEGSVISSLMWECAGPAILGLGKTRQEFRAYESLMCCFEKIVGERRSRWVKHQNGEGERWSHDIRVAHTLKHPQTA